MTRKDYILIADATRYATQYAIRDAICGAIREARAKIRECEPEESLADLCDGVSYATDYIADALARDNPRFDRAKFLEACGAEATS